MKTVIRSILAVVLSLSQLVLAQDERLDSLTNAYNQAENLADKTHLAIALSHTYVHKDDEKSIFYALQAVAHANKSGDLVLIAESKEIVGDYYGSNSNFLGAADFYTQALLIYESHNMYKKAAAVSNNIANAYLGVDDVENAEEYYKRSYNIGIKAKDTNAIAVPLVGLSLLYDREGEFVKAMETTEEALVLFERINRLDAVVICYTNAAEFAYNAGLKEKAFNYSAKGKEVNEILQNDFFKGSILLYESEWYAEDGQYEKAIKSGEEGITYVFNAGAMQETKIGYKLLAEVCEKAGDMDRAYTFLKKYNHIRDSLEEINRTEIMAEVDAKFNKVEDEKKIAELSHESTLHQLENEKNKTILYVITFAAVLLLFLLGFAVNANRQKKKANKTLQIQKSIIEEKSNEILDSIQYAKRIQDAIIPSDSMISSKLENCFVLYKPKDIVAGDFYWMEEINETILFAVADCTGHGVPGAMVSVVCHNALNRSVREFNLTEPARILDKTRELVIETFSKSEENVKDGMDITLCAWNRSTGELQYAGANNPLYILSQDELTVISPDKQPIGNYENMSQYTNHQVRVKTGDAIYLFSDGFVDQFGGKEGKKYKYKRFKEFIRTSLSDNMKKQGEQLENEFNTWKGELEQLDDVCVIGLRL